MIQGSPRRGLRLITMLVMAGVTFGGLSYIQSKQVPAAVTQGGVINPDASVEDVINHIQSLPDSPQFKAEKAEKDKEVEGAEEGKNTVPVSGQDMVDLEQMMGDLINMGETHNAANTDYQAKLTQLCQMYPSSCTITTMDESYSAQQQFSYQLMVVYVINKLEEFDYDPLLTLKTVTINNYSTTRRGYANAKLIVINTHQMANYKEFLQVLAHEMGHVIDLGAISGTSSQINPDYTEFGKAKFAVDDQSLAFYAISWSNEDTLRSRMTNQDFVSGYGMSNPFEDFAECHNMYLYHRDVFAYMAGDSKVLAQKYEYFDRLYKTRKLSANFNPTDLTTLDVGFRPWDTTRM